MLQRGRMNDVIDAAHRHFETALVPDIADEIAHQQIRAEVGVLLHFVLFQLVSRKNDETLGVVPVENGPDESAPE